MSVNNDISGRAPIKKKTGFNLDQFGFVVLSLVSISVADPTSLIINYQFKLHPRGPQQSGVQQCQWSIHWHGRWLQLRQQLFENDLIGQISMRCFGSGRKLQCEALSLTYRPQGHILHLRYCCLRLPSLNINQPTRLTSQAMWTRGCGTDISRRMILNTSNISKSVALWGNCRD